MKISRLGEAPDYRFSLANERTFLAWIRTALGFLAAGLALINWPRILPRRSSVRHLPCCCVCLPAVWRSTATCAGYVTKKGNATERGLALHPQPADYQRHADYCGGDCRDAGAVCRIAANPDASLTQGYNRSGLHWPGFARCWAMAR